MGRVGMKMRNTPEGIARRAAAHRAKLDALVLKMHAEYQAGASLHQLSAKYGRTRHCVRDLFTCRGLPVRAFKTIARQPNGAPVPYVPKTDAEIRAIVAQAERIIVPPELKFEWRRWDLARRAWFVRLLRDKLQRPEDRPLSPFSSNVEPFDYGTPRAHEIAARMNAGLDSRTAAVQIHIVSQGVIYRDQLYFWAGETTGVGAYYRGPYIPRVGRPSLHRVIWEEANGRRAPRNQPIRHADGNLNNFDPANLVLASRNDVARENQAKHLLARSRQITALLLDRSQKKTPNHATKLLNTLSAGQRPA